MSLRAQDITDLVNGTLKELGRMKIQQIAQNYVDYPIFNAMFKGKRYQEEVSTGYAIQRTLMVTVSDSARHVGLYEEDARNVENVTTTMSVRWAYANVNWSFDEREILHNRGEARIFNLIEPRRESAKLALVELIEQNAWQSPGTSSDELKKPFGIPYWVVKPTSGQEGHLGGHPSGHSDVGGVNTSTYTTFKNWVADYADVTKADLITKMRTAHRKCRFVSPVGLNEYAKNDGNRDRFCFYTNSDVISDLETVGEAQNENLGRDVAPTQFEVKTTGDGGIMFRRLPIKYVPFLDDDTTDPLYGLDHDAFKAVTMKGYNMKEQEVVQSPTQHNVYTQDIDLGYNYLCFDRRRQMCFAKV
jgi:hypothetical protein